MRQHRTLVLALGVFVMVLISMQLFLLMIGLEALLTYDRSMAWIAAVTSTVLATVSALLYRYLRHPSTTAPRVGARQPRSTGPRR
jgi:membrane protein implicated in regulation of membrane protease activity